jgi:vacuolar protein sorting-associated protein 54
MFSNPDARKSVDSLATPTSPSSHRGDFPFHRQTSSISFGHGRRGSTASSIHSVGGSLDTASGSWSNTVLEAGQNAISTLLQPPIVRTGLLPHTSAPASSAHKPPTAKDIPPVALTNIPHVDASEFRPYLTQVGALYEQLRRAKESEEDPSEALHRRGSKQDELGDGVDEGRLRPGKRPSASRKTSVSSIPAISPIEAPSPVRRTGSGFARRGAQGPPPLSTIPNVYFDEDFHLENPRTFDIVSERSEVVRPPPRSIDEKNSQNGKAAAPRKALATNAILQEKLSWYMDTIEMHLITSISTASTTFFTALGSLKELHTETAESVDRIKSLRQELQELDAEIAVKGLDLVQKQRRRENLQQLHAAVQQLKDIIGSVTTCEALVDEGEIDKALDAIDALEKLIAGDGDASKPPKALPPRTLPLRDLRGAAALQGVSEDVNTLRFRIGKGYESKLVTVLMGDLRKHVESVSHQEVLMRWSSASMRARGGHSREPSAFPSYLSRTDELRAQLLPNLGGLQRAKHLTAATQAYRESVLREIRNVIRRPLPSSTDDDNESMMSSSTLSSARHLSQQQKSSILARNLRALLPEDAEELLIKIYIAVTEALRRLQTQVKVLLEVASSLGEDGEANGLKSPPLKSPPFSPTGRKQSAASLEAQEELHKALDVNNLVGQAVDIAQDKIVRLLRVRKEESQQLSLPLFLRYFTLNLHFANECESISGRSGTTLKTAVNTQIKEFVQKHGDVEKQRLAQEMESDTWVAIDFTEKNTQLLNQILESSDRDAAAWSEGAKVWIPYKTVDSDDEKEEQPQANGTAKAKTRAAIIEDSPYLLPASAVLCMDGMSRFMHLMVAMPSMTSDVAYSLVAYLQLFNSRCTQLILGAGATRSAGLKNITTKHLALASQAVAFLAALAPHVREFVRRRANAAALMGEFDKVKRAFQEHQNSIYDKLVEIMAGRAATHSRTMRGLDWDAAAGPDAPVHPYMDTLVKETATLHRNLTRTLPDAAVGLIMTPVFASYRETFGGVLKAVECRTEQGRDG